jgi:hypothetical protein
MQIHTVVVDGPLALQCDDSMRVVKKLWVRQILTLPLLAARLAGGLISPASAEILYPPMLTDDGSCPSRANPCRPSAAGRPLIASNRAPSGASDTRRRRRT